MNKPHIVIIGGGFGGLYTAKALRHAPVDITLIDRHNYHLFQPLLYQVATGGLSPGDIASPLRAILSRQKNVRVLQANAQNILPDKKQVVLSDGVLDYDMLVVATGVHQDYFGNDAWREDAPGLKDIGEALDVRRRIFLAFEAAERESDPVKRQAWLTFVVVGGGPTGVELAGALGELAHHTLHNDFRQINPHDTKIYLVEGQGRILPPYPAELSAKAAGSLAKLGVTVRTNTLMTGLNGDKITLKKGDEEAVVQAKTVLWAAGVKGSSLGKRLAENAEAELDKVGRVKVEPDLSLAQHDNIFVIGDLAYFDHHTDQPLPGVAQVAMQQGEYLANLLTVRAKGEPFTQPFRYKDKGSLAVIGRNKAVAEIGTWHLSGFLAWLIWIFIHIAYLIGFDNRLIVMVQWGADYFTRKRGARLITGDDPFPLVGEES